MQDPSVLSALDVVYITDIIQLSLDRPSISAQVRSSSPSSAFDDRAIKSLDRVLLQIPPKAWGNQLDFASSALTFGPLVLIDQGALN